MTSYNLASVLEGTASTHPEREAIILGDTRPTYAQVNGAASQVANLLASRGVVPGDNVALSFPNLPYFTIVYFGILMAGATVVPLNVLLKSPEVAYHMADAEAKAFFCFEGTPELSIGAEGHAGFEQVEGCEHFFVIIANPTRDVVQGEQMASYKYPREVALVETLRKTATRRSSSGGSWTSEQPSAGQMEQLKGMGTRK